MRRDVRDSTGPYIYISISAKRMFESKYTYRENLSSKLGKSGGLLRGKEHWFVVGKDGTRRRKGKHWSFVRVLVDVLP